jgi:hypothetical protein
LSNHTANKELIRLRATFNYGKKKKWISYNPTDGLEKLPITAKQTKYIPSPAVLEKVISFADQETQDYLPSAIQNGPRSQFLMEK